MQARKQRRRAVAIALAFLSAVGLVVAAFGDRWLTVPEYGGDSNPSSPFRPRSAAIGLRTFERCKAGTCTQMSNSDLIDVLEAEIETIKQANLKLPAKEQLPLPRPPWHGFPVVGLMAFVFALIAAAGLLVGGVLAAAGKRVELPIMPTTIAVLGLALSIITACIFIATKPDLTEALVVGWTFITYGVAAVVGLAAVFPLNRAIRPIDAELGEAAATMSWGGSRDDQ